MCTVFCDVEGIVLTEYIHHKVTATDVCYANLLCKLYITVEKYQGKLTPVPLHLHDNAPTVLTGHM